MRFLQLALEARDARNRYEVMLALAAREDAPPKAQASLDCARQAYRERLEALEDVISLELAELMEPDDPEEVLEVDEALVVERVAGYLSREGENL